MPESQNIEWKQSWRDEYLKWICGFANAKGGKIYIGKDDQGRVVGVENFKRLMDDIPNKITSCLGLVCDVNLHQEENQEENKPLWTGSTIVFSSTKSRLFILV
jgi:ATP-dependent DNA helicase RecG